MIQFFSEKKINHIKKNNIYINYMSDDKSPKRKTYKSMLNPRRIKLVSALSHGTSQAKDPSFQQADTSDLEWRCRKCDYKGKGVTNALEHRKCCKIIKGGKKKTKKRKTKRKKTKRKSYKKKH
jgi:hypothetical protein